MSKRSGEDAPIPVDYVQEYRRFSQPPVSPYGSDIDGDKDAPASHGQPMYGH